MNYYQRTCFLVLSISMVIVMLNCGDLERIQMTDFNQYMKKLNNNYIPLKILVIFNKMNSKRI